MEISEKSNFKTKILAALLVFAIIFAQFGFIGAVRAADENRATMADVKLNKTVKFDGPTYWLYNFKTQRKNYDNGKIGMGIVGYRLKSKNAVHIIGEGFIRPEQIFKDSIADFIVVNFNLDKDNKALTLHTEINGERVHLVSDNTGIIKQEGSSLLIGANGTTNVKFIERDEKSEIVREIPAVATAYDGGVKFELNSKDKSLRAAITDSTGDEEKGANAKVTFGDKKVVLDLDAHGNAKASIANGALILSGEGDAELKVNGKEIARVDVSVKEVKVGLNEQKDGIMLKVTNAKQSLTLFNKVRATLTENAELNIHKDHVDVDADAALSGAFDAEDVSAKEDQELLKAAAGGSWKYGKNNPEVYGNVSIAGKEPIGNTRENMKEVKIIEAIDKLKGLVGGASGLTSGADVLGTAAEGANVLSGLADLVK